MRSSIIYGAPMELDVISSLFYKHGVPTEPETKFTSAIFMFGRVGGQVKTKRRNTFVIGIRNSAPSIHH